MQGPPDETHTLKGFSINLAFSIPGRQVAVEQLGRVVVAAMAAERRP